MMAEHFARNVLNLLIFRRRSGIFRVAFLFDCHYLIENFHHIFRCVPAWQVFVVASCSSAATLIEYHVIPFLSTTFFHFLENQFRSMRSYCLVRSCSLEQRIVFYHRCFRIASSFFKFLKTSNSVSRTHLAKRRKRDLNPRAGINRPTPLAGAPLQPLEYFSKA